MEYYVPGEIYNNLQKFIQRIGCEIKGDILSEADLKKKLNSQQYVQIIGTRRGSGINVVIVYADVDSVFHNKTANIKKLISEVVKVENSEIHIITHTMIKQRIIEKLEMPLKSTLYNHLAKIFLVDPNDCVHVPNHEIADPGEVSDFCHKYYKRVDNFPKILSTDPQAVWIGAKKGDVVKITRASETALSAIVYRLCV